MTLFINACVRCDSRTKRLADHLLDKLKVDEVREVFLPELKFPKTDEAFPLHRKECVADRNFSDPLFDQGKEFASADTIVIAAPFWDLSFPATLKQYFEQYGSAQYGYELTMGGIPFPTAFKVATDHQRKLLFDVSCPQSGNVLAYDWKEH